MFEVTYSSREKSYTREGLTAAGITEENVVKMLDVDVSHQGWVCECDSKIVGFVMGNGKTGEVWVLVILPDYEGKGIGSKLYDLTETWLGSLGWKEIWLGILQDIQVRGYAFFKKRGWVDDEMRGDFRIMKKRLSDAPTTKV